MDDWLEQYQGQIEQQPTCEETWFQEQWRNSQSGNEAAGRNISGSCLRLALRIAQQRAVQFPERDLVDFVEEANAGLMEAVLSFGGVTRRNSSATRKIASTPV